MSDFNRSPEAQEVFKSKRKPKGPIKFNVQLNEEQKQAKEKILYNTVTILKGKAGSGKSLLAANVALDLLFSREIETWCIINNSKSCFKWQYIYIYIFINLYFILLYIYSTYNYCIYKVTLSPQY